MPSEFSDSKKISQTVDWYTIRKGNIEIIKVILEHPKALVIAGERGTYYRAKKRCYKTREEATVALGATLTQAVINAEIALNTAKEKLATFIGEKMRNKVETGVIAVTNKISIGQYYEYEGDYFLLAATEEGAALVCLHDGTRWDNGRKVESRNDITPEEFADLCLGEKFNRVTNRIIITPEA